MAILLFKWSYLFPWLFSVLNGQSTAYTISPVHPLYISVTEIDYNAADKNLEISCKIFTDDFEKTLERINKTKVDLTNPPDKSITDRQITAYIKQHLHIKLDGKPMNLEYVGYEHENDATWSYFQCPHTNQAPRKVEITNDILYDSYDNEINIMHVKVNGTRKSTRLDYPDKVATIEF